MDSEALEAIKIYQRKHGGTLAEISILFVNVVAALKEAAQQSVQSDVCHKSVKKTHSWYESSNGVVCEHCGTRR